MHKVVINQCFGGFGLSIEARQWLSEQGMPLCPEELWDTPEEKEFDFALDSDIPRHNLLLVACVERLGEKSWGDCAELKVLELPGNQYILTERDGAEWVTTPETAMWTVIK